MGKAPDFDDATEVWFENRAAMREAVAAPPWGQVLEDEENFGTGLVDEGGRAFRASQRQGTADAGMDLLCKRSMCVATSWCRGSDSRFRSLSAWRRSPHQRQRHPARQRPRPAFRQ